MKIETTKMSKTLVIGLLGLSLAFGLILTGCGNPEGVDIDERYQSDRFEGVGSAWVSGDQFKAKTSDYPIPLVDHRGVIDNFSPLKSTYSIAFSGGNVTVKLENDFLTATVLPVPRTPASTPAITVATGNYKVLDDVVDIRITSISSFGTGADGAYNSAYTTQKFVNLIMGSKFSPEDLTINQGTDAAPVFTKYDKITIGGLDFYRQSPTQTPTELYSITGRVLKYTELVTPFEPVSDVKIQLFVGSTPYGSAVNTDASGTYNITGIPDGTYTIRLTKSGWNDAVIPGTVVNKAACGVDLGPGDTQIINADWILREKTS